MKEKDLLILQQMSAEMLHAVPGKLLVDGHGDFYTLNGDQVSKHGVLGLLENLREKAEELNDVIQRIEGRKKPT